jgi:hypothetical protein
MVDKQKIEQVIVDHFTIYGSWTVGSDGKINVQGAVYLDRDVPKIPVPFGTVQGDFVCKAPSLKSLENSPSVVLGDFICKESDLSSLIGAPKDVGLDFICSWNHLVNLNGSPQTVGGSFKCDNNRLTDLEGAPVSVSKAFDCSYNRLTSLKGGPSSVGYWYDATGNTLESLEGAPLEVKEEFYCTWHEQLPVLRTLLYQNSFISGVPRTVNQILRKYKGTGKKGSLGAAVELTKAGFKDNARW